MSMDNENFKYDVQVKDMLITVEGHLAKKVYSYLKEKNGFVKHEDDVVCLPQDLNQRIDVLNTLTRYLNIELQEIIVGSEYQQDYQEKIAHKINCIDKLIELYKKHGKIDMAISTLEDVISDLFEFRQYIFDDEKKKQNGQL